MKMLPTKSMRESTSTRTKSKLITTLMTTKRSLTSPRPIKRESTQMRSIKMGMTDKTTPSREMTSRPIKRGSTPIKEEMTKERSITLQGNNIDKGNDLNNSRTNQGNDQDNSHHRDGLRKEGIRWGDPKKTLFKTEKRCVVFFYSSHDLPK